MNSWTWFVVGGLVKPHRDRGLILSEWMAIAKIWHSKGRIPSEVGTGNAQSISRSIRNVNCNWQLRGSGKGTSCHGKRSRGESE